MRVRFPLPAPFNDCDFMLPILFELPFLKLKSLTLLAFLAFFFSAFVFWRKGREEHYNSFEIFDAFLLSGFFGFILGRIIFVIFHWSVFSSNVLSVFNIINYPGNEPLVVLAGAIWFLYRHAVKAKWDAFEVLDFYVTAISLGMIFIYAGFFLDGSYGGTFTNLPWGIIVPGTFEKTHPAQLYALFYYLLSYIYLSRIEYVYRTLEWYRSGKKTAQSGFLFSTFLILTALFHLITGPIRLPGILINGMVLDYFIYLAMLIFGLIILYQRSGRSLHIFKK
jgi:phosphatidylglycerol:prolipoprotein diacylglycerol transferase